MTKKNFGKPPRTAYSLGGTEAENDWLLQDSFYESAQYQQIISRDDRKCFLVGRTGAGKSAILTRLEEENPEHIVRIDPDNLSLPYITSLDVIRYLTDLGVQLDHFFNALWKHVLLIEIIRHRYQVDSEEAKNRFLALISEKIKRDRSKQLALQYLEDFEGRFWVETDERVREITDRLESQIKDEAGVAIGNSIGKINLGASDTVLASSQERTELAARFQRIINDTQMARLNQMIKVLDSDILDSSGHFTYVVIDDLDKDWVDESISNDLIRCLFRAVNDLKKVQNLKVIVALRTNIFDYLDFGPKGGQEEKYRALTIRLRWTHADIERLLTERVKAAGLKFDTHGVSKLTDVLPSTNKTRGDALAFILRRTLMRPRDAISYLNECYQLNGGRPRISWDCIHQAQPYYSRGRLLALRDEWKPTFPGIDRVFELFRGASVKMDQDEFRKRLDEAVLLMADSGFSGTVWMTKLGEPILNSTDTDDWSEVYQPLTRMLFEIGFIGGSDRSSSHAVWSYEDPGFSESKSNLRAKHSVAPQRRRHTPTP
ncbi:P-loop ATPase, Sll1717 family, partial [Actinocatenispora rupis]